MSDHTCHASLCKTPTPPRLFMCPRHWRMLPTPLKSGVLDAYVPGQERDYGRLTNAYFRATAEAMRYIEDVENVPEADRDSRIDAELAESEMFTDQHKEAQE